jgi:hypothetical protein
MAAQSTHVCCQGQSGGHLLAPSISWFDPEAGISDDLLATVEKRFSRADYF